jgi:SAM-dependent methyltransferase
MDSQKDYWNGDAGQTWVREARALDAMLEPVGVTALKAAHLHPGERVLDVGCGAGALSREAAALGADVTGVDISAPLLGAARDAGGGPTYVLADAGADPLPGPFDALISRFGVMFFSDPVAAFAHLHATMKPSGRMAVCCWRSMAENDWAREPLTAVLPHLTTPPEPPADPHAPGPFALADAARTERILIQAGWTAVNLEPVDIPYRVGADAASAKDLMLKIGPLGRLLREQPEALPAASQALDTLIARRSGPDGVMFNAAIWLVTAKV